MSDIQLFTCILQMKHLELASTIWDSAKVQEQWKNLTFTHMNNLQIWTGYLNHVRTSSFAKSVPLFLSIREFAELRTRYRNPNVTDFPY